jgi:hypothetical protein
MKIIFLKICIILLIVSSPEVEAKRPTYYGFIIGFTGLNETFDHQAFFKFAKSRKLLPIVVSWRQETVAYNIINNSFGYYELYGFSKGAETTYSLMNRLVKNNVRKPDFIITIGAHKDTNVDFGKFNVKFNNYFDVSGIGSRSPGIYVKNREHLKMQEFVTNIDYDVE